MKPSFALVLTQDTIGLLHRTSQGWQTVGDAAVSDPELTEALGFLRQSALGLDPQGVTTKLVIPNSEILYTTVNAPGPSAAARRSQIKAALEGMTPYAVRDLVFDWSGKGAEVQVAVVARETLQEAEEFASQHRLGPLSFVGSPLPGTFDGEPWFGPAAGAESLLGPGEKVERDNAPVPVSAGPVSAVPVSAGPVAAAPDGEPAPRDVAADVEATEPAAPLPPVAAAAGADDLPAVEPAAVAADPLFPEMSAPEAAAAPRAEPEPVPTVGAPPVAAMAAAFFAEPAGPAPDAPVAAPAPVPEPSPALVADPNPPPFVRPLRADVIAQSLEVPAEDVPAAPLAAKQAVASSAPAVERLKARLADQPIDPRRFGSSVGGSGAGLPLSGADAVPGKMGGTSPAVARGLKPVPAAAPPLSAPTRVGAPGARPAAARVASKGGARGAASMVTSPSIPIPRDRRVNIPGAEAASDARAKAAVEARKAQKPDADGLTSFGARQTRRGKPRYLGLILTGVLLIVLAIVAAWSTMITADNTQDPVPVAAAPAAAGPEQAGEVARAAPPDAPIAAPAPPEGSTLPEASAAATPEAAAPRANETAAESSPADLAATDPQAESTDPDSAEPSSQATLATSGGGEVPEAPVETAVIAQPDVPAATGRSPDVVAQDEIFLAATDAAVPIGDLVALAPPVASTDPVPGSQPLPPPFGTVYQFDDKGLILPTPEGIVTPEGVRLVLGRPSRVPPARPADLAPPPAPVAATGASGDVPASASAEAAAASVAGVVAAPAEPAAAPLPAPDPAFAGARPRARPADLAPGADDDAALPQPADTQLTSLRPRARPAALFAAAEAASAAEAAALPSATASLAATAADEAQVSPLAVAVSRKPAPRPRDFSRAVEAAVASIAQPQITAAPEETVVASAVPEPRPTPGAIPQAAPTRPAPEPKPAPAAKPKEEPPPDEIDEPEVASAAPDLPTRANVAKQATFRNAINLSRINLIGVYGSSSNRYALVRQPNGRYVKVEVGDRVDGGKVAAISERELRYVKNGRTVTLAMPKG